MATYWHRLTEEQKEHHRAYKRAYSRRRKAVDPEYRNRVNSHAAMARLRRSYGISRAEYEALFVEQGGLCAICRRPSRYATGRLAVDHDHRTGRVRWLLCDGCNRFVGLLEKEPQITDRALAYLDGWATAHRPELRAYLRAVEGRAA